MTPAIAVREDFDRLHHYVKANLDTFKKVGQALAEIRDRKLYKEAGHLSFKAYCHDEFHHDPSWARRLIRASQVAIDHDVPTEAAARELAKHPEELRGEIVDIAKDRQGEKITAPMIQDVAYEVKTRTDGKSSIRPDVHEFVGLANGISGVMRQLISLGNNPVSAHLDMGAVKASLKTAHDYVKIAIPTHECFACHGEGCKICKDLGWVPEAVFDRRPEEFA